MQRQDENQEFIEQIDKDQNFKVIRAKQNWQKVRRVFQQKHIAHKKHLYHLIQSEEQIMDKIIKTINIIGEYTLFTSAPKPQLSYLIHQHKDNIDTTGTWVWEAQNIMAYYLFHTQKYSKITSVLELGAGTSGLASLVFGMKYKPEKILITDGKQENINFLTMNVLDNGLSECARVQKYIWGKQSLQEQFGLILAADCLFFENYHEELILTFQKHLQKGGTILLVNPKRGKSMLNFLNKLKLKTFEYQIFQFEDEKYQNNLKTASKSPLFERDKDFYYFIEVNRAQ